MLNGVAEAVHSIQGNGQAIDVTGLIHQYLASRARELASQSVANAHPRIASTLEGFTIQDVLMGPDPCFAKVKSVQEEVVADFKEQCQELHESILTEIPDAIASLTHVIERAVYPVFTSLYQEKRERTIAEVRRQMKAAADQTAVRIRQMSTDMWENMSDADLKECNLLDQVGRHQVRATADLESTIQGLPGFNTDGVFKSYFDDADRELKESVKDSVALGWELRKMTSIVSKFCTRLTCASAATVCPVVEWAYVGPFWRWMLAELAQVHQCQLSPTLVEECVDAHKTYGRSWATLGKFGAFIVAPVLAGAAVGGLTGYVLSRQTTIFGVACMAAIMEYPVNATPDAGCFKSRVQHHAMARGIASRFV
jgi:hypothetical protein